MLWVVDLKGVLYAEAMDQHGRSVSVHLSKCNVTVLSLIRACLCVSLASSLMWQPNSPANFLDDGSDGRYWSDNLEPYEETPPGVEVNQTGGTDGLGRGARSVPREGASSRLDLP